MARALRWLGLALAALACHGPQRIVVGSKNFTESDLLGEIVAQQIERRTGLPVERRLHLGGSFVCHQAITTGAIDIYVEYTGTAFTAIGWRRVASRPKKLVRSWIIRAGDPGGRASDLP